MSEVGENKEGEVSIETLLFVIEYTSSLTIHFKCAYLMYFYFVHVNVNKKVCIHKHKDR